MAIRKRAKILEYNCIFQSESEGGYSVWVPTLPGCASQGETFEETQKNITESIELYLEDDVEETKYHSKVSSQFMAPISVRIHA